MEQDVLSCVGGSFNNTVHNYFPPSALKPVPKVREKTACQFLDLL